MVYITCGNAIASCFMHDPNETFDAFIGFCLKYKSLVAK